jgi:hypothetical protein
MLSLHTNAHNGSASGTRLIYSNNNGAPLARSIKCYMKEIITSQMNYENFKVAKPRSSNKYGETRLATMPSVLIEVAFHDNPSDAAALKDPVFRNAALKGIEKGWRILKKYGDCKPLKITDIPDAKGTHNTSFPVKVKFEGYPTFPVTLHTDVIQCPPGWSCNIGDIVFPEQEKKVLKYTVTCSTSDTSKVAKFVLNATLEDSDGVKTEPVKHRIICKPPKGEIPVAEGAGGGVMAELR